MFKAQLRSGNWLTTERITVYSAMMVIALVIAIIGLVINAQGILMPDGQPLGTDFSDVFTAGKLALKGQAAASYDWEAHWHVQKEVFGQDVPYYAWSYPPLFS